MEYIKDENYIEAYDLYVSLKEKAYIEKCMEAAFEIIKSQAIKYYNDGNFEMAQIYFKDLNNYQSTAEIEEYFARCDFWYQIKGNWYNYDTGNLDLVITNNKVTNNRKIAEIDQGEYTIEIVEDKNIEDRHMKYQLLLDNDSPISFFSEIDNINLSDGRALVGSQENYGKNIIGRKQNVIEYRNFIGLDQEIEKKLMEPKIGMTDKEVLESAWGKPDHINKTTYTWGITEQWCYSGYRYIYLENGVVTAISE